jgi:L-malate glycosyltransferase
MTVEIDPAGWSYGDNGKARVLHCAYSGLGGHAAVLFSLLSAELCNEFDHFVLFFGVEDLREEYAEACMRLGVPFAFVKKRGRLALRSHGAVIRIIGEVKPDVVMVNGTPLAIPILGIRSLHRSPWAVVVRETQANHLKTLQEWVGSYLAARVADVVVYLTPEYRAEVEERLGIALRRGGRVRVIPNGVETEEYVPRLDHASDEFRLAMVSRIVPIKDHPTLIEAVRLLVRERNRSNLRLFIAGDGPSLPDLRARAAAAGIADHIVFTGTLSGFAVTELLRKVDVYVHCTFGETMSNSILQAMAAGVPVVASDVDGVSNLIRDSTDGMLVPVEDAAALAGVLDTLIRDPATRDALGRAAHERVGRELSRQRMVADYTALFAQLAAERTDSTRP